MPRNLLIADALAAGKAAKHNLEWMAKHPERIDQNKRLDMEDYLNMMIVFAELEIKNARRAGRTSLRTRLKYLVVSIIAQPELRKECIKQ